MSQQIRELTDDRALVDGVLLDPNGHEAQKLVMKHAETLVRFLRGKLNGNAETAEDIAQEVWVSLFKDDIKLLRKWRTGPTDSLRPLLLRIAHRRAVDFLRHESSVGIEFCALPDDDFDYTNVHWETQWEITPEQRLGGAFLEMVLREKLDPRELKVIQLKVRDEMSNADIGASLDPPVQAKRVQQILRGIRDKVQADADPIWPEIIGLLRNP